MSAVPLAVTGTGMLTGVGFNAPASCAAIRCAVDNFQDTRFMDSAGEWIRGSEVRLEKPWRGRTKLLKMAAGATAECLATNERMVPEETPLLLCLPEQERKGRVIDDDNQFFLDLQKELGVEFHRKSRVISNGHVAVSVALKHAQQMIRDHDSKQIIIAAADSLLVAATLSHFEQKDRLLTSQNSNGFIPGEAGAALLVERAVPRHEGQLICRGLGFGLEKAHVDSELPLRADGLTAAIRDSLKDAGCAEGVLCYKITDIAGEQYHFKEASIAFSRIDRTKREEFQIWHPADCIGEVGAAIGLVMVGVLKSACEKGYGKGDHILAHLGNDDGKRSAMIFAWTRGANSGE